jgi:hypothetical protein
VRGSIFACLIALGCTGGGTRPGDPCSLERTCADDQVCDMTAPGGAVCIGAAGDVDGDGLDNGRDFCQHQAGGAFDEDSDGIGDECDRCPIGEPPGQAESDGDDVDSPCDPDPRTPGHRIALFDGFNALAPGAGAWRYEAGDAIMTPSSALAIEQIVVPLALASNRMAILSSYRLGQIVSGTTVADVGVVGINELPMGSTEIKCGSTRSAGGGDQLQLETNAGVNTRVATDLFDPTSAYRLAEQLEGGVANCALVGARESAALQGATNGDAMNQVGIYARGATVRFAYLLVIQR